MGRAKGLPFLFYFVLILLVALQYDNFHTGTSSQALDSVIYFKSTLKDVMQHYGIGDPGSFALGGLTLFHNKWFDANTVWLINLWPPGFMFLEACILKIFGEHAPIIIILQVLASLCLATTLGFFNSLLTFFTRKPIALLIPLMLLIPEQSRLYLVTPDSVLRGETFAISFALAGLFCLYLAYANNNKKTAIMAGIFFGLSAWFRSQFEMFFMVATLNVLLTGIIYLSYKKINNQPASFILSKNIFKTLTPFSTILIAIVMFHATTLPYRIYGYTRTHNLLWVQTSNLMMLNNFVTSEVMDKNGASFLRAGGANTPCVIAPKECAEVSKQIAQGLPPFELRNKVIHILLQHPEAYISMKLKLLPEFWFSSPDTGFMTTKNLSDFIFIICFLWSIIWILTSLRSPLALISYWLSSSIVLAYGLIFIFAHYETRYFIFFKIYFLVMAILGIIQLISQSAFPSLSIYFKKGEKNDSSYGRG